MSYILEALKKSDKKRQQDESASTLHKTHPVPPAIKREKSKRDLQVKLSIVVILLLIGLISYRLIKDQPAPTSQNTVSSTLPTSPPEVRGKIDEPPLTIPELTPGNKKILIATPDSDTGDIFEPQPLTTVEPLAPEIPQQPKDTTPYLEDFPPSFQDTVPKFRLAGHVYSPQPELRLLMINNKIVREGEILEEGFILYKITQDGVILDKNNERFQLKAY